MTIKLTIQNVCQATDIPSKSAMKKWVEATVGNDYPDSELCIRIVDANESQELNNTYRNNNKPTNVLSFGFDMSNVEIDLPILGDLVICADIINQEAKQQHKKLSAHWAHMVIHGTLHLLGYDHQTDQQAHEMEPLEIAILQQFNYDNPYEEKQ